MSASIAARVLHNGWQVTGISAARMTSLTRRSTIGRTI
jgi:hypothetical protein